MEWLGRDALFVAGGAAVGLVLAVWAASALCRIQVEPGEADKHRFQLSVGGADPTVQLGPTTATQVPENARLFARESLETKENLRKMWKV
jgi:hypothetical protein